MEYEYLDKPRLSLVLKPIRNLSNRLYVLVSDKKPGLPQHQISAKLFNFTVGLVNQYKELNWHFVIIYFVIIWGDQLLNVFSINIV